MRSEPGMNEGRKPKPSHRSGLALIESLYFRAGREAAQGQLSRLLGGEQSHRAYAVCDRGQPAIGLHTLPVDDIEYESFGAPISWNAVYSIQKVKFGPKVKSDFLFHPGEEILIPTRGQISYHFFWSPGASRPDRVLLNPPLSVGEMLRVNPQIPHHAWATKDDATAWLILRHAMNSPVALVMNQDSPFSVESQPSTAPGNGNGAKFAARVRSARQHRVSASDLRKPGAYGMIAWGISESIRDARLKAGINPTELARKIGVDPSSISRLEEAKANVSVEMLAKVCSALRIGMAGCMEAGSWIYQRNLIDSGPWQCGRPSRAGGMHYLHASILRLEKGASVIAPTATSKDTDSDRLSSWIVLSGRVMAELPDNMEGKSMILDADNVIHFREYGEVALHALQDCAIAQVVYSSECACHGET